jgi:hypothetical protein
LASCQEVRSEEINNKIIIPTQINKRKSHFMN